MGLNVTYVIESVTYVIGDTTLELKQSISTGEYQLVFLSPEINMEETVGYSDVWFKTQSLCH